jgi:hypothetical protein
MVALVEKLTRDGSPTREAARRATAKPKPGRPRAYTFDYRPESKAFRLRMRFRKGKVDREEIIEALEALIRELRRG